MLVELQARFDEEANIRWARALEAVGAHVVYGIVGYKTHCKACLVVRQEADGIRRYCHLATGNYNVRTSGVYADFGLFTARDDIGQDVPSCSTCSPATRGRAASVTSLWRPPGCATAWWPASAARPSTRGAGRSARIIAKMNSLVDRTLIDELYRASHGGRAHRPDRARHLLPATRRARPLGGSARSRSSIATSSTPACTTSTIRCARVPPRFRGLDAAQPRQSCGGGFPSWIERSARKSERSSRPSSPTP